MKNIFGIIGGLITAMIIFMLFEYFSKTLFPSPKNIDFADKIAMKSYIDALPVFAFLIILAGYAVGSFLCGFVIGTVSKTENTTLPVIAGLILTAGGISNIFMIPHPVLFSILNIIIYIPMVLFGHRIGVRNVIEKETLSL